MFGKKSKKGMRGGKKGNSFLTPLVTISKAVERSKRNSGIHF
jgi:hypothetical protein